MKILTSRLYCKPPTFASLTSTSTYTLLPPIIICCFPRLLTRLEVLEENVQSLRLLSVVSDDDTRAANDLPWVTLSVDLAETSPGTEGLWVGNLEEVNLVLVAESLDELDVLLLGAGLDEDTEVGLSSVQSLGALTKTSGESIVDERLLENLESAKRERMRVSYIPES